LSYYRAVVENRVRRKRRAGSRSVVLRYGYAAGMTEKKLLRINHQKDIVADYPAVEGHCRAQRGCNPAAFHTTPAVEQESNDCKADQLEQGDGKS